MVAGTTHHSFIAGSEWAAGGAWLGKPINSIFDLLTSSILLPLGGLLLAVWLAG